MSLSWSLSEVHGKMEDLGPDIHWGMAMLESKRTSAGHKGRNTSIFSNKTAGKLRIVPI
jgi:hypothetical protein